MTAAEKRSSSAHRLPFLSKKRNVMPLHRNCSLDDCVHVAPYTCLRCTVDAGGWHTLLTALGVQGELTRCRGWLEH